RPLQHTAPPGASTDADLESRAGIDARCREPRSRRLPLLRPQGREQPSLLYRESVRVLSEVARVRIRRLLTLRHGSPTEISGSTMLVGILGWPVAHSLSPRMHNAAFAAVELEWPYVALPPAPDRLDEAVGGLVALGFVGANVTTPHKV